MVPLASQVWIYSIAPSVSLLARSTLDIDKIAVHLVSVYEVASAAKDLAPNRLYLGRR